VTARIRAVPIRWITAFIDRPAAGFDEAAAFWLAVAGSTLSPRRGPDGAFATLLPADGDAFLRVQRIGEGRGGTHLDLHVEDVAGLAARAVEAGATVLDEDDAGGLVVLRSPAGLPWCAVAHHGEAHVPPPVPVPTDDGPAAAHRVDQVCIDIPPAAFDAECRFWGAVTGWEVRDTRRAEFRRVEVPDAMPLRLLLQRLDDDAPAARAHLDVASSDRPAVVAHHVALGAEVLAALPWWTTLRDPAGVAYCVTTTPPT
jgi:hypothetical protein